MIKESIYGKTKEELTGIVTAINAEKYRAGQICNWMYDRHADQFDQMSNLPINLRDKLKDKYDISVPAPVKESVSIDGTKKYLFKIDDNHFIETAYIPDRKRATLCVSTQVGCKMGCKFCMTAKQGFKKNLTSGEILNQYRSIPDRDKITNIVYMGMGEPLDNINNVLKSLEILTTGYAYAKSPTRITVSTIGIIDGLKLFLEITKCNLAVSLHSPFEEQRNNLMPVTKNNPLTELFKLLRKYNWKGQRNLTFEYIMLKGINDSDEHIKKFKKLIWGLMCNVNVIGYNPVPGSDLESADQNDLEKFNKKLNAARIFATIRKSRGQDINAACGLLSTKEIMNK